jgi:hypothetical protein
MDSFFFFFTPLFPMMLGVSFCLLEQCSALNPIAIAVNGANTTWTADIHSPILSSHAFGTFVKGNVHYKPSTLPVLEEDPSFKNIKSSDLPTDYDLRTYYPNCSVISKIRDQSSCGSCWAFSAAETFEDRRCIATQDDIQFSPLDVGANSGIPSDPGNGCAGGFSWEALEWMQKGNDGIVTGGDYADDDTGKSCMPYAFPPCAHHVPATPTVPVCPAADYRMKPSFQCSDKGFNFSYYE